MNSLILLTALSAGQPPGVYLPPIPQPGAGTAAQPPMTLPMAQPPMGMPPAKNGDGEKKEDEEKKDEEKKEDEKPAPEPYALMRALKGTGFGNFLDDNGITISGWVQGNYTASTASRNNLPVTFNDRADFWQFNQLYLKMEKSIDTSKSEFQLGGRIDLLYGSDARFSVPRGLFDDQIKPAGRNGALPNYFPVDIFQMYGEAFLPNLGPNGTSVKVGRFATLVGYELVQGAETPFLQRSYLFQYNPFTHSGAVATTQLNDTWAISYGLTVGTDNFFGDTSNKLSYIGQLKWAPKEGKSNLLLNVVLTDNNFQPNQGFPPSAGFPLYNVYNAVFTHNFTDRLTYVADTTFSHIDGAPLPANNNARGSATWYGAANYLIYKHCNDKFTSNFRVELFEDTKGFRTGFKGLYTEVTYGLAYAPVQGLIFRPTVRYDHNNDSRPFEGKSNLFTAAFDMILRY